MKQTTPLVLLTIFFGLTFNLQAQTDKLSDEERERQELSRKVKQGIQIRQQKQMESATLTVAADRYNHREGEIMSKLNTQGIPSDFPVYKPEYTNQQYTQIMEEWYLANPLLLKKEDNSNQQK